MTGYAMQAGASRVLWGPNVTAAEQGDLLHRALSLLTGRIMPGGDLVAVLFRDVEAGRRWHAMTGHGTVVRTNAPFFCVGPRSTSAASMARLADADLVLDLAGAWVRGSPTTAIQWTEATWNPWVGCSIASAGCNNCYAASFTGRGLHASHAAVSRKLPSGRRVWTGKLALNSAGAQYAPVHEAQPKIWFTASLTDVFHPSVPDEWLVNLHDVVRHTPHHVFQILTKRPERAEAFYAARPRFLLQNIWLGTSVEDARVLHRVDVLRRIPVPNDRRFLSAEPLIGPLTGLNLAGIRWVIAGGESGPHELVRRVEAQWVRDIRDLCLAAEVPFFLKQWGIYPNNPLVTEGRMTPAAARVVDPPAHAKGGAMLDGRLWRDVPDWRDRVAPPSDPKSHRLARGPTSHRAAMPNQNHSAAAITTGGVRAARRPIAEATAMGDAEGNA